jgi:hypothetical protein
MFVARSRVLSWRARSKALRFAISVPGWPWSHFFGARLKVLDGGLRSRIGFV